MCENVVILMKMKLRHKVWPICIMAFASLALMQSCNSKLVGDVMEYPGATFGLDFDSDPRFGFKEYSVEMPNIEGLSSSFRWAYCHKDSCNTGYYVVGVRCPEDKVIRQWVSDRLWEEMKGKGYDEKAPKDITDDTAVPISYVADFYLDQWQSHYDSYLNDRLICEKSGAFSYPTEQTGLIITDVWQQGDNYTMCVHRWHDMMSNGYPCTTSYYTIDSSTGKVLTLKDLVAEKDIPQIERQLKDTLAEMKQERNAPPLQDIVFLEACSGVALIKEGLLVYYHAYTIGAGFEGEYNVVIPYDVNN